MRFSVLGALEVLNDSEQRVPIRSTKQRTLLAVLLAQQGHAASVDRLIEDLWTDDTPASAAKNVQLYVHRIRRALGEDRIEFRPPGYRLRVEDGELDTEVFEKQAIEGRDALARKDFAAAGQALAAALGLWRGEPYAGLDEPAGVRLDIDRLCELRLAAFEDRIEADLALGRHNLLVPELAHLAASYPMRERLRGQQMLALYRSGRPAEALEVYRSVRDLMVDELALEPGAELRRLQSLMLNDDEQLTLEAPPAGPADAAGHTGRAGPARPAMVHSPTVPAELPPANRAFTGRTAETELLGGWLAADRARESSEETASPVVVAISGPGGIGKSTFAIQAANAIAADYPDGQVYVNLHGATPGIDPLGTREVIGRFLRSLGLEDKRIPHGVDEACALFRSLVSGRRILIMLDNAAGTAQVRPLLPGNSDGCAVIVTSRSVLSGLDGAQHVRLDALSDDDALTLLANRSGRPRAEAEPEAAAEIVHLCGNLPLAVQIAGARLAARPDWSLASFAARLGDSAGRLDELQHADLAVRQNLAVSVRELCETTRSVWLALGAQEIPTYSAQLIAANTGLPEVTTRQALDRLYDAQLVELAGPEQYALHDLARLYLRELFAELPVEERRAPCRRGAHWYIATARAANQMFLPRSSPRFDSGVPQKDLLSKGVPLHDFREAIAWVDAERDNVIALLQQLMRCRHDDCKPAAVALSSAICQPFTSRGYWRELLEVCRLAEPAAEASEDPQDLGRHGNDYGNALVRLGFLDEGVPHLERALAIFQRCEEPLGTAAALYRLGYVALRRRDYDNAIRLTEESLELRRGIDAPLSTYAEVTAGLALIHYERGDFAAAVRTFEDAVCYADKAKAHRGKAISSIQLAEALRVTGDARRAIDVLEAVLPDTRAFGLRLYEAQAQWNLAEAANDLGDPARARRHREEALAILVERRIITPAESEDMLTMSSPPRPTEFAY